MRLFTAITLNDEIKDQLFQLITKLRNSTSGGTYSLKDNLHLTLNFIGETNRIDLVKQAMDQAVEKAKAESFVLSFRGYGRFKRREGDIYWVGAEQNHNLSRLQKELVKELKDAGFFDIDDRDYKPHLTLARKISANGEVLNHLEQSTRPMNMPVSKISLMKSERLQGKLTYTEIYHVELGAFTER